MANIKGGAYVRLRSNYSVLLPSEKKIADYIIKNSNRVDELSIAEIASHSGASNATVTRFCKRLGFDGLTVRQGKRFEIEVDGEVTPEVLARIGEAAEKLLANTVIESFDVVAD